MGSLCVCSCLCGCANVEARDPGSVSSFTTHPPCPRQKDLSLSTELTDWLDWLLPSSRNQLAQGYRLISTHSAFLHEGWRSELRLPGLHTGTSSAKLPPKPLAVFVQQTQKNKFSVYYMGRALMQQQVILAPSLT